MVRETLYPEALLEMSSVVPWMLSIGLESVGMLSLAVPATEWSVILSVIVAVSVFGGVDSDWICRWGWVGWLVFKEEVEMVRLLLLMM